MAPAQYYVYSLDTAKGVSYFTSTNPKLLTSGTRVGGPFPTQAQAQTFISGLSGGSSFPGSSGPGAGFPQWTVSSLNNQVAEVTNAQEKALAEAAVYPNTLTFFSSQAAADAYAASQGGGPDTSKSPLQAGANAVGSAAGAAASWTTGLGNFLGALTNANTWIRVAKVLVGGTLLIVGIAHITGASGKVAAVARKVPLPV